MKWLASVTGYEVEMRLSYYVCLRIPGVIYRICLSEFNTALCVSIKFHSWPIKM